MSSWRLIPSIGTKLIAILIAWSLTLPAAFAQTGAFFDRRDLSAKQYSIEIDSSFTSIDRQNFANPTFLFGSDLDHITLRVLETEIRAHLDLLEGVALQLELPLLVRRVEARYIGLKVSESQTLDAQERVYSGAGLGDPTMSLSVQLFELWGMDYFLDLGTRIPLDDSPEGQPIANQIPLSTGQNELFVGGGFNTTIGPVRTSLSYRHSYFPGNTTAYLVRRASNGSWVNGSTSAFIREAVTLAVGIPVGEVGQLELVPNWTLTSMPGVTERGGVLGVSTLSWVQEVNLTIGLSIPLGRHHVLRPYLAGDLLQSWDDNPFYPIEAPKRGLGLAWQYTSY